MGHRLGSGPPGWDLGLEAKILTLRLGFGPRDWDLRGGQRRRRRRRRGRRRGRKFPI